MKISVVIATYNGAKYIQEQLDSIVSQTYIPDEIIISDDCSKDNTIDIIRKYISKKSEFINWKIIINKTNKGYAKNFLDASLSASGDIIFFCDQDDIWEKEKIELMKKQLYLNQNINLLCSNLEPFYYEKDTRKWSKKVLSEMKNTKNIDLFKLDKKGFHLKRSGCTMCVRKKFLTEIIPYWIEFWAHDDFVWKMAALTNSCGIFQYKSLKRRMHSTNATVIRERSRNWRVQQLFTIKESYESMLRYIKNNESCSYAKAIIIKNINAINLRLKVVKNRKVLYWLILLIKYKNCYPRKKGLYLDLYLAIFKKYIGV